MTCARSPSNSAKRLPSMVADMTRTRRSSRRTARLSNASASPRSLSRWRSCASSNSTAETPASSGSARIMFTKIASVTTRTRVRAERLLSSRVTYPTVSPGFSPNVCAMRSAAARAATRRGDVRMTVPLHQPCSSSAGATAVVLPAPGGATSTPHPCSRKASSNSGMTERIGRSAMPAPPERISSRGPRRTAPPGSSLVARCCRGRSTAHRLHAARNAARVPWCRPPRDGGRSVRSHDRDRRRWS